MMMRRRDMFFNQSHQIHNGINRRERKTTHDMLQPTDYNNHKPNCHIELTKSTKVILEITALAAG